MADKKDETPQEQTAPKADAPKKAAAKKAAPKAKSTEQAAPAEAEGTAAKKAAPKKAAPKKAAPKKAAAEAESGAEKPASSSSAKSGTAKSGGSSSKAASSKAASSGAQPSKARQEAAARKAEGAGGTLKVHHLRPAPGAHTAKTRVGRGEASKGKTAGRGTKGTKARYQVPEAFEGGQMPLHMRLPKLRGFKNPFRVEYQVVNLDMLASLYPKGGQVTVEDLVAKGAVRKGHPVKVLGNGDVEVKLEVSVQKVSASAREKILAAGGSIAQD